MEKYGLGIILMVQEGQRSHLRSRFQVTRRIQFRTIKCKPPNSSNSRNEDNKRGKFIVTSKGKESKAGRRNKSNTILVVDDEPDANMTLRTLLEENGFETDAYPDPRLALQNFKPGKFDLLLLDIKMPNIGGFELYQKMKEIDKEVKVCFVTASELFYEEYRENRDIDEKYFMLKPMKNEEMMKRIYDILNENE